ncbi:hypothetical protein NQ314_003423 [Rhamnusium bicolor]|uniref:DDE Tnp4 domain-containing protein n=1 Tax=Rhamnusium bicolor TaxID=1586634 RepID=A0AAV8ZQF6_9CUCU|nr:hypothetical protein NQ314_003423 [Rhamnusium bicolor]
MKRYLGSGCNLIDLHYQYQIGHSTIRKIVHKVCKAIWTYLKEECFPVFSKEKWLEIADGFRQRANFPNCLGALDGKHVRMIKPELSSSLYFNYKKYFSVVLFAIVDSNYLFTYVDIGTPGKDSDSSTFEKCTFYRKMINNDLDIPTNQPLRGTESPKMPFVFLGDEAFALTRHVMRPYSGNILDLWNVHLDFYHTNGEFFINL